MSSKRKPKRPMPFYDAICEVYEAKHILDVVFGEKESGDLMAIALSESKAWPGATVGGVARNICDLAEKGLSYQEIKRRYGYE